MKTLFERLKPEIKEKLLSEQSEYPSLIGDLLVVLKENVAVTELKLGDLSSLTNFSPNWIVQISELYDMFES
jgi:hypothetical protein